MPFVGCLRYKDRDGCSRRFSYIRQVSDLAKLETFTGDVAPLTGADCFKIAVTETRFVTIPGAADNLDLRMSMQVNVRVTATGERAGFMLPAPALDCFDDDLRLKPEYGAQLAQFYTNLTGLPCTFLSGARVGPQ